MKKIFLLLAVFSMVFTSCEPLEDIYEEIDAESSAIVGKETITLTDEDYETLELDETYFETNDVAAEMIPTLLAEKYPVWGAGSKVTVNFNLSNAVSKTAYTVTDADYAAIGLTNLASHSDFNKFFEYKFPEVEKGSVVNLTYKTPVKTIEYTLTEDDYDLVGNGRFDNFDIRVGRDDETIEARRVKIQTILLNNFPDATVGQQYDVTYAIYDGAAGTRNMLLQLNSSQEYNLINSYTLTDADFDLVGNGRFNNFDIRPGRAEETEEARRAKIETILLNNFPSAVTGDKYIVTYAVWEGFASTRTMLLEFNGTGYDIDQTLVIETTSFALTDDWKEPFTLAMSDYEAMGQTRDNFNGRTPEQITEVQRIIGVYLGQKYPFAYTDDFIALQYNSYAGGGVTNVINVNYIFDGSSWNAIPVVLPSSLDFVHDGNNWNQETIIEYELIDTDYTLIADTYRDNPDYAAAVANLETYGNISTFNWTNEQIDAAINTVLNKHFSSVEEDQKFAVTIFVYDGSSRNITVTYKFSNGVYTRV